MDDRGLSSEENKALIRIAARKIVSGWASGDSLGLLQQFGAVPSMSHARERPG